MKKQVGEAEVVEYFSGGEGWRSVEVRGAQLETGHEGLEEEVVEVGGGGGGVEGATVAHG